MDKAEIAELLAKAASFERFERKAITEADVDAWHEAIGDLTSAEASAALIEHFRTSRERVMPADIIRIVLCLREQDALAEYEGDVRRAQARARETRTRPVIQAVTTAAGDHRLPAVYVAARAALQAPSHGAVLVVTCPWCEAGPGQPCTVPGWPDQRRRLPHSARYQAAGLPEPDQDIYRRLARVQCTGTAGDMSAA